MAWTAPYLFVAGQILTAAQLNTYVSDNLTFLKSLDNNQAGWIADTGWSYASATTANVPAGAASRYSKGDKWKLTANGVVLQGYIITVADTLLTVVGDALTNHAFSAIYFSHEANPLGFTHWFNYTSTTSGAGGSIGAYAETVNVSKFSIVGGSCITKIMKIPTNLGSWTGALRILKPIPVALSAYDYGSTITSGGANIVIKAFLTHQDATYFLFYRDMNATAHTFATSSTGDVILIHAAYPI